jgi:succinate-semialdehyde dehydrogenase/glutarate-semialdehyde dehydrogenase
MAFQTLNPATGELLERYDADRPSIVQQKLDHVTRFNKAWQQTPLHRRCELVVSLADQLLANRESLASLITLEMGKIYQESLAEVDKSIHYLHWCVQQADQILKDRDYSTAHRKSYVHYQPLGTILAIMPWNYPIWQVIRLLAPALITGNTVILKPAANVPQCSRMLGQLVRQSGLPEECFLPLFVQESEIQFIIAHNDVRSIHLTGSTSAGRSVGAIAGRHLKKCVMELGGSDPFIVLNDADIDSAVEQAIKARFINNGQSCIAAKRFIIEKDVFNSFEQAFVEAVRQLNTGDPMSPDNQLGPMARRDLLERLESQVQASLAAGATCRFVKPSTTSKGFFTSPTVLTDAVPGSPAWDEELFGPVATLFKASSADHAIELANNTPYGLGASLWSQDLERAERLAKEIESGATAINRMLRSEISMPFGGAKNSGFGREMGDAGFYELTNPKTIIVD